MTSLIATVSTFVSILPMLLLLPWGMDDRLPDPRADIRPVVLVATDPEISPPGFDGAEAARKVVEGAALRLEARGIPARWREQGGNLVVGEATGEVDRVQTRVRDSQLKAPGTPVYLHFSFGVGENCWASGSETRFGGVGNASWRLAVLLQRHTVRGMWDVLAYDSYDRGVVEELGRGIEPSGRPVGLGKSDPWVVTCPLFVTNSRELSLLERPGTLDLLSTAMANAICEYLDPTEYTPRRDARLGWRGLEPRQPVRPGVFYGAEHSQKIALTFDGGASAAPTPAILDALRDAGVRATMFMTADFVERNPELVIQMAKDGHEFGNHSSTHPDMTQLSYQTIVAELDHLEASVKALTGRSTRPWFRPPFGACDDRLVSIAAEQGYYTVMWTADSADWRESVSPSTVQERLLTYATPGAILIQHLGSPQSARILPDVLRELKARGASFGTLSEVLGTSR